MKVAIIGSGISGNAAAWALTQPMGGVSNASVTLYESRSRPGGHSATIDIDYNGQAINVDIGFIVYNTINYPDLVCLFNHLGVETVESDMSFGVSVKNGKLEWSGKSLSTIFAQRRNFFSFSFWHMIRDILRFNKCAAHDLENNLLQDMRLGDYLTKNKFSQHFINHYLAPMGAAIWSTPHSDILDFPAHSFISFFNNHRLMHPRKERPKWRTVRGGSRSYVHKIIAPFQENIRYNTKVECVERKNGFVHIWDNSGKMDIYDHVIFASHTDQTLAFLKDATHKEKAILSAIPYRPNKVYLHRDPSLMPKDQKVWSSWNYIEQDRYNGKEVCVSYNMNMLQNIPSMFPLFVTLNPPTPPRKDLIFYQTGFDHPQFTKDALRAQKQLPSLQGQNNCWFCGAWTGYGFHEDGLRSGLSVAQKLGACIPWRSSDNEKHQQQAAE